MLLFYMVRYLFYTIGDLTYQSPLVRTAVTCAIYTFLFVIKPTRGTNFTNLFCHETLRISGQFVCPSSGVYSLHTQQWYMSYRFVDSFRAGLSRSALLCCDTTKSLMSEQPLCPKSIQANSYNHKLLPEHFF